MSNLNIIRAWKDEDYSESLSREEQVLLPQNPAGLLELSDEELAGTEGQGLNLNCVWSCLWSCNFTEVTQ
jgi:mersacidin/lichenicidin family type 2 lantibiotic